MCTDRGDEFLMGLLAIVFRYLTKPGVKAVTETLSRHLLSIPSHWTFLASLRAFWLVWGPDDAGDGDDEERESMCMLGLRGAAWSNSICPGIPTLFPPEHQVMKPRRQSSYLKTLPLEIEERCATLERLPLRRHHSALRCSSSGTSYSKLHAPATKILPLVYCWFFGFFLCYLPPLGLSTFSVTLFIFVSFSSLFSSPRALFACNQLKIMKICIDIWTHRDGSHTNMHL